MLLLRLLLRKKCSAGLISFLSLYQHQSHVRTHTLARTQHPMHNTTHQKSSVPPPPPPAAGGGSIRRSDPAAAALEPKNRSTSSWPAEKSGVTAFRGRPGPRRADAANGAERLELGGGGGGRLLSCAKTSTSRIGRNSSPGPAGLTRTSGANQPPAIHFFIACVSCGPW